MCDNTDEPWKHYTSERCQTQNRYMLHDSSYMKYAKEENLQRQKAESWFSR